jgi:tetratricopeptide (TPR) repeat protein
VNDRVDVSKSKAEKLYLVLRKHLRQSANGRQLVTAFENDPEQSGADLARYLREHLPADTTLAEQIAEALGNPRSQFTSVVTGGQVEQLINIARLGVLNLTLKKYFFIFRDVKQVVAFLLIVLAVGAGVAYGAWRLSQPQPMTGDFNIAVAEFVEKPASSKPTIAPVVSQMIFSFLDSEYQLGDFGNIQVTHDKIGVISGAVEAQALAEAINADTVIYGDVTIMGDKVLISPKFYVAGSLQADIGEINGQHQLGLPVEFSVDNLIHYENEANVILRQRTSILTEFTKGLVYLAANDLNLALEAIQTAIRQGDEYGDFEGKEILYLFASHITRLQGEFEASEQYVKQALALNESYARAYIAWANIYYSQQKFELALDYYEQATHLEDQAYGAYISEKANLGIGNIYTYQYQIADETEKAALAEKALTHLQRVIDAYQNQMSPKPRLKELAAGSYYSSGIIYQHRGDFSEAMSAFGQVLKLTQNSDLKTRAQTRLDEVDISARSD